MRHVQRLLITGSSGTVGRLLVDRLAAARPDRRLRLLDLHHPDGLADRADPAGVELVEGSVTDAAVVAAAVEGVDAVLHLGGISVEGPWRDVLEVNVHGTFTVLDEAARAGVRTVVLASSNHAVGMTRRGDADLPADAPFHPDTYYGWSKTAGESLGRLFVERAGLDVVALRIGSCRERPQNVRELATWLSPDDCARLVEASVDPATTGFHLVWGVSRNTRRWWSLAEGEAIGYRPADDAEVFAAEVERAGGEPVPVDVVGGSFTRFALGTCDVQG